MGVLVLSKARKLLSHSIFGSSLAGDGLLVRLRSTSIALLGLVTAVGLGLIAFISQLGWPGVLNAPIPGSPAEAGRVHRGVALTQQAGTPAPRSLAAGQVFRGRLVPSPRGSRTAGGPGAAAIDVSRQLAAVGAGPQSPASAEAAPEPTSTPAPEPAPSSPPAPAATPEGQPVAIAPAAAPPQTSSISPQADDSSKGESDSGHGGHSGGHQGSAGQEAPTDESLVTASAPPPPPPQEDFSPDRHGGGEDADGRGWHRH